MAFFEWDITEPIPAPLPGRPEGTIGKYRVTVEDYDIAVGNLPFLVDINKNTPYERQTAQWRKDQFDNAREVGEQSLTGWWLRSQANFSGGSGITYFEPLLGEGSEFRFRKSSGVDVFTEAGEVTLLKEQELEIALTSSGVDAVAGLSRVLVRDGSSVQVWNGTASQTVTFNAGPIAYLAYAPFPGTPHPPGTPLTVGRSFAYTGSEFLIGTDDGILSLDAETGTAASEVWSNAPGAVEVYWAKERIFAVVGPALYELTMAGGDMGAETPLFTHPDPNWRWTGVTETAGAVWAAGFSGVRSNVHVIAIGEDGATPALTGSAVGLQLPHGERIDAILGYLDFLLIGTNQGLRVAAVNATNAALGPRVFDGAVHSVVGHANFAWCGMDDGLTRKVDLGNEVAGDLGFAWANDAEVEDAGAVLALNFVGDRLSLAVSASGLWAAGDNVVESGTLTTGFIRYGTLEPKHYRNMQVSALATTGTIGVSVGTVDPLSSLTNLAEFSGSRNVSLHLPGDGLAQRLSVQFQLNRDTDDTRLGPTLQSYQLRAIPAPERRQRMIQMPVLCFDNDADRWGNKEGGPGFAWARLRNLEQLEETGAPVLYQDFRTGESRFVVVESLHFIGTKSPNKSEVNSGGRMAIRLRTVS